MPIASYKTSRPRSYNPFQFLYQLPAIIKLIVKRQRHYLALSFLALLDIILAVGLVTNASFFSQAVDRVVLLDELKAFSSVTGRPPLSTSVYVFPSRRAPVTLQNAEELSHHLGEILSTEVGLPIRHLGVEVSSGSLMLKAVPGSPLDVPGKDYLGNSDIVYISKVSEHMQIVEGDALDEGGTSKNGIDIWVHEQMAQSMGLHIGEKILMGSTLLDANLEGKIAGIWKAKNPKGEFWFNNPDSTLKSSFLVRRDDYINLIQPRVSSGTGESAWYIILDEKKISPKESQGYLDGFLRADALIKKVIPGSRLNTPPLDPLEKFVKRSSTLTVLLLGYNLPAFGILLYFLSLTSAIIAQWQKRETVMLVSRGMSIGGVLNLTLIEQMILFIIGYPLGILFGMLIAYLMGYTASFLSFTGSRSPLPVSMEGLSVPLTILALAFSLFSRLLPAMRAARSSLVTEERERARPMNKPFWYRFYLDLILLVPTFYAYDQMVKRGSLAGLVTDKPEDLYRDPLLIIVPALFILTTALVTMRLFALFMRLVDLIAGRIPWLTFHLALRQLGRQSLDYVQPLLLVIISLSMGVYTLSMAASLDQWSVDRMYYSTGADFTFTPMPNETGTGLIDGSWIPFPQDFPKVNGIERATRIGDFEMRIEQQGQKEIRGRFLAIDRAEFPSTAWFRPDFAYEPLGAMMNRLALAQEGILVSQELLNEKDWNVGDRIPMSVSIENLMTLWSEFTIVGTYNNFPTVYDDKVAVIGNLDYLSTMTGLTVVHDIWLKVKPGTDTKQMIHDMEGTLRITTGRPKDTRALVETEQGRMERVGIFGTLSVGFLATAIMAILGLLIYSYASLQERAYRLAVLNAVGLSRQQILAQVVMEYAFLALFGALAGAFIGLLASELFVPFFRFTGEEGIPLPPLIPIIASGQLRTLSAAFGGLVVGVEVITIATILRNRLVQILKRVWI